MSDFNANTSSFIYIDGDTNADGKITAKDFQQVSALDVIAALKPLIDTDTVVTYTFGEIVDTNPNDGQKKLVLNGSDGSITCVLISDSTELPDEDTDTTYTLQIIDNVLTLVGSDGSTSGGSIGDGPVIIQTFDENLVENTDGSFTFIDDDGSTVFIPSPSNTTYTITKVNSNPVDGIVELVLIGSDGSQSSVTLRDSTELPDMDTRNQNAVITKDGDVITVTPNDGTDPYSITIDHPEIPEQIPESDGIVVSGPGEWNFTNGTITYPTVYDRSQQPAPSFVDTTTIPEFVALVTSTPHPEFQGAGSITASYNTNTNTWTISGTDTDTRMSNPRITDDNPNDGVKTLTFDVLNIFGGVIGTESVSINDSTELSDVDVDTDTRCTFEINDAGDIVKTVTLYTNGVAGTPIETVVGSIIMTAEQFCNLMISSVADPVKATQIRKALESTVEPVLAFEGIPENGYTEGELYYNVDQTKKLEIAVIESGKMCLKPYEPKYVCMVMQLTNKDDVLYELISLTPECWSELEGPDYLKMACGLIEDPAALTKLQDAIDTNTYVTSVTPGNDPGSVLVTLNTGTTFSTTVKGALEAGTYSPDTNGNVEIPLSGGGVATLSGLVSPPDVDFETVTSVQDSNDNTILTYFDSEGDIITTTIIPATIIPEDVDFTSVTQTVNVNADGSSTVTTTFTDSDGNVIDTVSHEIPAGIVDLSLSSDGCTLIGQVNGTNISISLCDLISNTTQVTNFDGSITTTHSASGSTVSWTTRNDANTLYSYTTLPNGQIQTTITPTINGVNQPSTTSVFGLPRLTDQEICDAVISSIANNAAKLQSYQTLINQPLMNRIVELEQCVEDLKLIN